MKLKKELNLLDVFSITAGAILSSGLFILPGLAHAQAGPAILISYILAALLATAGMLSQAELASAMPRAGGTYFYVTLSMGSAVGTLYGITTLLALSLKSAFELVGMAVFTRLVIDIDIHIIAASLCLIFVFVNIIGAKEAGRVQVVLVSIIIAALLIYVIRGLPMIKVQHFEPLAPQGIKAMLSTAGFVFLSYGGLLKIASIAEEVKDPGRVLPLGMILSLLVVVILYTVVIFVTVGVLDDAALDNSLTPVSDGATVFLGSGGRIVLSIAAVLAFSSAANAGIMGASRYPLALSRDDLLPGFLGKINSRFKTPHIAILMTGILIIAALFLKLDIIIKAASSVLILTYIFTCLAIVIMRESRLQNYQPRFRAPLYPWIQIIGIIGFVVLLFEIGREALLVSLALIGSGLFVYWFYGRIRSEREYALLHLIERITAKELTTHSLETELKEIITERDDIIKDRFDRIIERSVVLDIDKAMQLEDFFRLVAEAMAEHLREDPEVLLKLLLDREKENSTVLNPDMAIPHIVIEGEHTFDILLARCREGIVFSGAAPRVHTIFVLIGTRDERNFHLRALAAIAQIVQDPHFEEKWMEAKSEEALRDLVLLGKRRR
ncbi:MAG: amino acid permease [Deltaproteobacteria bacterium]|nr:MAG: amino acid permease [Deltaproteobacteria bacterium]